MQLKSSRVRLSFNLVICWVTWQKAICKSHNVTCCFLMLFFSFSYCLQWAPSWAFKVWICSATPGLAEVLPFKSYLRCKCLNVNVFLIRLFLKMCCLKNIHLFNSKVKNMRWWSYHFPGGSVPLALPHHSEGTRAQLLPQCQLTVMDETGQSASHPVAALRWTCPSPLIPCFHTATANHLRPEVLRTQFNDSSLMSCRNA